MSVDVRAATRATLGRGRGYTAGMTRRLLLLSVLACLLAACGNKGALVLPDKPAPAAPPATPAQDPPPVQG